MAYKFSKGDRKFGDIKAEGDAQGDTLIDFEEDQIDFQTSGSVRMRIENDTITTTVPIHISGSVTEGLRIAKAGSDYREIQFETNGVDTAFIQVDASEGMIIGCQSDNDEIIFMTKATGQSIAEVARITANGRLGIQETSPSQTLDVGGHINVSGTVYHEDFLMAELSIPGLDLQTDTNAFRFNCPYSLDVEGLQLFLDQHTTSGNVTVTVSGGGNTMITLSLTGTNTSAQTTTVSNGSLNGGDAVTFAITATPANAQGLRANLQFRRVPE